MAFVNEQLSEYDQQKIDYSVLKHPQTGRAVDNQSWWTVDRENDVFLLFYGGGMSREDYHVPFHFLFGFQDVQLRIQAFQKRTPSDDPMLGDLTWEVTSLQLPETLSEKSKDVLEVLTGAFKAFGHTGGKWSHLNLKNVHVDFSKLDKQ